MNSSNSAGNLPSPQGYPPPVPDQQFQKPVFNQEELRVLRECNLESFYFRCVPLAAAFTSATYIAMRRGIFKVSEKFGYTPKMLGAAFIGYFAGKLSYQNACAEKLMKLPNSPVGEALRKRKGRLGFQESLSMEPGFSVAFPGEKEGSGPQQPIFDDHRPDLRDHNEGLDEYQRGVTDSLTPYTEVPLESAQSYTTYEELRRQNREEYVNRMADKYRKLPAEPTPEGPGFGTSHLPEEPQPQAQTFRPPSFRPSVKKNQYGDEVYD
ncbi:OCIA domain-containing protein 1-like isoform X1 [Penaeus chinensis]|uniref:OCIA domain-containing protein 1-like isoform X1 n=1 Tax=Penaeus chinensis TaxID=139456 RepID=UPI001FB5AA9D|nr:OCIA domain-containing protein 1-like isoform X1 [Penaeus chinensis]